MRVIYLFVVILIPVKCFASQMKQEGAVVNYCNTKYVTECYAITRRIRRGAPYLTNLTLTTRYSSDNNVTVKAVLVGGISLEVVKTKLCDVQNVTWLFEYFKNNAHIDMKCPFKAGRYGLFNMEFPPKNMPLRISDVVNGKFHSKFYLLVTKTEEIIMESTVIFHST